MDESVKFIKERKLNVASAKQQFSMTAINNLALMLSDTFSQMQQMMANAMPGQGGKGKKGKGASPMSIGEKQDDLNKSMEKLSKSGKSGRGLSEEAAKLAQEQSQLRKRIQQMQDELKGTEIGKKLGNELKELEKKMDENETDLVNKRINPDLIKRSRDVQTRLLEAEKAVQQQEEDPTRQSKAAQQFNRSSPPSMDKFLQEKQKQVELIRTVPPNYTPFYKKQTDNYFRKIK
jgi:predicted  nucleic acid-binding Zn-ribbon protein